MTSPPDLGILRFLGMLIVKVKRGSISVKCVGEMVLILVAARAFIRLASLIEG